MSGASPRHGEGEQPATMRAVFFLGPERLEVRRVPVPRPGPGEVLAQVEVALTCGTDLKAFLRGHRLFRPPMPFGHEWAGRIVAIGEGVEGFVPGQRVTAANSAPCQGCFYCDRGQPNLCDTLSERLVWGACAEYLLVPAPVVRHTLLPIPEGVSAEAAACVEPLACVVLGAEVAGVAPGDVVVVLGGSGPIGLMHCALARARGAIEVIAVGRSPARLAQAAAFGATRAVGIDSGELDLLVAKLTGGRGADVVIEAVGLPEIWQRALALVRKGGSVLLFGGCRPGTEVPLDAGKIHYGQVALKGAFHLTPASVRAALDLVARGAVPVHRLISERRPLDEVELALRRMAEGAVLKVALVP